VSTQALEREQRKLDKALKAYTTMQQLKAEEQEKKRIQTERRQMKLQQIDKDAKRRIQELKDSLEKQEVRRRQVLDKNKALRRMQLQEQLEAEQTLQQRMNKFERQQRKRQKALSMDSQNSFRVREQERRRHSAERIEKESRDAESSYTTLSSLKERLEHGDCLSYEMAKRRAEVSKKHVEKVEGTLTLTNQKEQQRTEEQLKKVVGKIVANARRKSAQEAIFKEKGSGVSRELQDKFAKHSKTLSLYEEELRIKEEELKAKHSEKEKLKAMMRKHQDYEQIKRAEKTRLRQQDWTENYERAMLAHQKSKQKVLDKHHRLKEVAEQVSVEKSTLADKSLRDSFHLQSVRTGYRSMSTS
jgi:hypothetical protein